MTDACRGTIHRHFPMRRPSKPNVQGQRMSLPSKRHLITRHEHQSWSPVDFAQSLSSVFWLMGDCHRQRVFQLRRAGSPSALGGSLQRSSSLGSTPSHVAPAASSQVARSKLRSEHQTGGLDFPERCREHLVEVRPDVFFFFFFWGRTRMAHREFCQLHRPRNAARNGVAALSPSSRESFRATLSFRQRFPIERRRSLISIAGMRTRSR